MMLRRNDTAAATGATRPNVGRGPTRDTAGYLVGHALTEVVEWVATLALVVHAYNEGGPAAAGTAAVVAHIPPIVLAPIVARLVQGNRPARALAAGLAGQLVGMGAAGAVAIAGGPLTAVVAGVIVGLTAVTAIRPAGAILLPALVRTAEELTASNVVVGRMEAAAGLVGPLAATGLLALGGAPVALLGCAVVMVVAVAATVPIVRLDPGPRSMPAPLGRPRTATGRLRRGRPRTERRKLRRPETTGALLAWSTRYMLLGAFDVVLVVIAAEYIDFGQAGAGVLSTIVGLGSIASIGVASRLARARRLGPRIMVALAVVAVSLGGFGLSVEPAVAIVALIVCGFALSVIDLLARVLLQRSAPPSELGHLFGVVEVVNGVGLVIGALVAKFAIAASGPRLALWAMAVLTGGAAVFAWRGLRRIDAVATMPVVDMSLLTRYPVFATLPPPQLELLARSAVRQPVAEGDVVIREGEEGQTFFAVCTGTFDVTMSGRSVRRLGRGDGFGEIALLARVPRTATVTTVESGELLVVDRDAFLLAVTGHAPAHDAVWEQVARLEHDRPLPPKPVHPLHLPPESTVEPTAEGQPTPP